MFLHVDPTSPRLGVLGPHRTRVMISQGRKAGVATASLATACSLHTGPCPIFEAWANPSALITIQLICNDIPFPKSVWTHRKYFDYFPRNMLMRLFEQKGKNANWMI